MSGFTSFPSILYCKVIETGEVCHGGGINYSEAHIQLAQIRLTMYKCGAHTGDEQFRLKLYMDSGLTKAFTNGTSDWLSLDDISNMSTNWLGRVAFTFSSQPRLSKNDRYYVALETSSYTRVGNSFYIAPVFYWPISVNENTSEPFYGWQMEVFGYRRLGL
jgi:hypothetical protein